MSQVLSNIFHETDQILIAEKERLVLVTSKNDTIIFVFNNGTFLINNMSTFPNNRIKLFQFNYFMGNNSFNENTWFERDLIHSSFVSPTKTKFIRAIQIELEVDGTPFKLFHRTIKNGI